MNAKHLVRLETLFDETVGSDTISSPQAQNAISTITVHGIAHTKGDDATDCPLHMARVEIPKMKRHIHQPWEPDISPHGYPEVAPSRLPPEGDYRVELSLEPLKQTVGCEENGNYGRCGHVFAATPTSWSDSSTGPCHAPSTLTGRLPPLAVKIARFGYKRELLLEASVYKELEHLQGVSIPRCYGLFEGELEDGWERVSVKPDYEGWDTTTDEHAQISDLPLEFNSLPEKQYIKLWDEKLELATQELRFNRAHNGPGGSNTVMLLLLERLGGRLPLGVDLGPELRADLHALFEDMATQGIVYYDIRYFNILQPLPNPPGFAGIICPYHHRRHLWRIIDFSHYVYKVAFTMEFMNDDNARNVNRFLDCLEGGEMFEFAH
ncbi:hypothetical protein A0H81_14935 [Grifola frondosa]|uniref:Protein kinase domain-containing protein n=1 Tax=Grifola frondosa TaxID=5627 RepID=A0A1C7LK49_GRIFR|nr:hypothetical protein A0H81_14935 [Grifola frondosa]